MLENRERIGGRSGGRRGAKEKEGETEAVAWMGEGKGVTRSERKKEQSGNVTGEKIFSLSLSLSPRNRARDAGACCRTSLGRGKRGIGEEGRGNCRRPRPW